MSESPEYGAGQSIEDPNSTLSKNYQNFRVASRYPTMHDVADEVVHQQKPQERVMSTTMWNYHPQFIAQ